MNVMALRRCGRWVRGTVLAGALLAYAHGADAADFDLGLSAYAAGDYATAVREWSALAAAGDTEAQYSLGELYEQGRGVKQDDAAAAKWYEQAADKGHMRAQIKLGSMLAAGRGVAQDQVKAIARWQQAAEHGSVAAQVHLAEAYRGGHGVARDYAEAERWYKAVADGGDSTARVKLFELKQEIEREEAARAETSLASTAQSQEIAEPAAEDVPAAEDAVAPADDEVAANHGEPEAADDHGTEAPDEAHAGAAEEPSEQESTDSHAEDPGDEHAPAAEAETETETEDKFAGLIAAKQAVVLSLVPEAENHETDPAEHGGESVETHAEPTPDAHGEEVVASEAESAAEVSVVQPEPEPTTADVAGTIDLAHEPGTEPAADPTFRVWLASFDAATAAESGWLTLVDRHGDLLAALIPFVIPANGHDGEELYRLQAGPFATVTDAQDVCRLLGERDMDCVVVQP